MVFRRISRSRMILAGIGWAGSRLILAYLRTLRVRTVWEEPELHPLLSERSCIFCVWHDSVLLSALVGAFHDVRVLISQSRDGEYIARIIEGLGYVPVRGSTTRGGARAVRQIMREAAVADWAITSDGPRGPRHKFQMGAVFLAMQTGLPLVPVGFASHRPWRIPSWDRFVIPRPFSLSTCYGGSPVFVSADASAAELADYRLRIESGLRAVTDQAEHLLADSATRARARASRPGSRIPERAADASTRSLPETLAPRDENPAGTWDGARRQHVPASERANRAA